MKIETDIFGVIEVEEDKVLKFSEGIPGFREEDEFILIFNEDEENPLHWLQSIKTPELAFVIVNPFEIYSDYEFNIPDSVTKKLEIEDVEDIAIYTIVVIPEDISKMTTNLMAPIIINLKNKKAKQIILETEKYTTKHYIINQESYQESKGGSEDANTI